MSSKCSGCGFYTLACQCKKDDNYCNRIDCQKIISNCSCDDHNYHYRYPDNVKDSSEPVDDTCNQSDASNGNDNDCGDDGEDD